MEKVGRKELRSAPERKKVKLTQRRNFREQRCSRAEDVLHVHLNTSSDAFVVFFANGSQKIPGVTTKPELINNIDISIILCLCCDVWAP